MKKLLLITMLYASIAIAQIPTNGLIAHYPFTGNANDQSSNLNNGTVHGATLTADRFGNGNSAYSFNGTGDYIQVPHTSSLVFPSDSFSISFWMKVDAWPTDGKEHYLFQKQSDIGDDQSGWHIYTYGVPNVNNLNNELVFRYRDGNESAWGSAEELTKQLPSPGTWFHVVYTTDSINSKMYVNGLAVDSNTAQIIGANTSDLLIGQSVGSEMNYQGALDDIRIYNRPLNKNEINALTNESLCFQSVTVTDTLRINANITGFNPITYQNSIKVYPNPTNDHITVDFGNNYSTLSGYTLKITNTLGQVVYTTPVNQQQTSVNLSSWTGNGLYFVGLINSNGVMVQVKEIVLQ